MSNDNSVSEVEVQVWNGQYQCPTCKRLFGNVGDITQDHIRKWARCPHCDQCLDWSIFYAQKSVRNSMSKIFKVPEKFL